jgi:hypothetical protein
MNNDIDKLINDLLRAYECPLLLDVVHPNGAIIGPDNHYYDKQQAIRVINGTTFKSPITRKEFPCSGGECLKKVPFVTKNIYDNLSDYFPDIFTDFKIENNILTKYYGDKKSIEIPKNVTGISAHTFSGKHLTSVKFPNSLTSIGEGAFANNQLTSLEFPDSLTSIGRSAFANNQLTSVKFPDSLTSIGDRAFYTNQLTSLEFPNSLTSIGDRAFANNQLTSVIYTPTHSQVLERVHSTSTN